jgi:hypothetical protein
MVGRQLAGCHAPISNSKSRNTAHKILLPPHRLPSRCHCPQPASSAAPASAAAANTACWSKPFSSAATWHAELASWHVRHLPAALLLVTDALRSCCCCRCCCCWLVSMGALLMHVLWHVGLCSDRVAPRQMCRIVICCFAHLQRTVHLPGPPITGHLRAQQPGRFRFLNSFGRRYAYCIMPGYRQRTATGAPAAFACTSQATHGVMLAPSYPVACTIHGLMIGCTVQSAS